MRIMGAYARRNMEDIDAIRRHTSQLEDGTAGIVMVSNDDIKFVPC